MLDLITALRYFDPETVGLDFKGLMEDLTAAPQGSVVVLHGKSRRHFGGIGQGGLAESGQQGGDW